MYQTHSSHLLEKVAGFLALPALGALSTVVVAKGAESLAPKANPAYVAAAAGTLVYGGLAYAFFKASESDSFGESLQCLFRGGMWGAGLAATVCAAAPVVSPAGPTLVSGTNPQVDKVFNLLTAQAAGAVALKRSRALQAAR